MKKIICSTLVSLCCLVLLLGCETESTHIKRITEEKLTGDKVTKVGYTAPKSEWQCSLLETQSFNWSVEQFKAGFMQNGYTRLQNKALVYAREKNLDVNYIFLDIPNQEYVVGINFTATAKAHINYLKCQYPPEVHNKLF